MDLPWFKYVLQDFSMLDTSCLLKNPLDKLIEETMSQTDRVTMDKGERLLRSSMSRSYEDRTLNRGMLETPDKPSSARYSPDVTVITLTGTVKFENFQLIFLPHLNT